MRQVLLVAAALLLAELGLARWLAQRDVIAAILAGRWLDPMALLALYAVRCSLLFVSVRMAHRSALWVAGRLLR